MTETSEKITKDIDLSKLGADIGAALQGAIDAIYSAATAIDEALQEAFAPEESDDGQA